MKARFTYAAIGIAAMMTAPAFAADVISEEPPAPVAVIEDLPGVAAWAGPYAGVTAGYGFNGKANSDVNGDVDTDGFQAGAFAGWQGQSGRFVYGAEADVNHSEVGGSNGAVGGRTKVDGSLRARAGVAVNDRVLVYGTAGGAAANQRVYDGAGRDTNTMLGYTVGAGADVKVTDRVFVRGEYRYTDYGSDTFNTGSGDQEVDVSDNRVLLGLGVKF